MPTLHTRMTKFQRKHRFVRQIENKCNGTPGANHICTSCGRYITKKIPHNPNQTGSLGYILHYSDGSSINTREDHAKV